MLSAVHQFENRLQDLTSFVDSSQAINVVVSKILPKAQDCEITSPLTTQLEELRSSATVRKLYTYSSSVSLLYAMFEQFVEELVIAYLSELEQTVQSFDHLPKKIVETHTEKSAQLLLNNHIDKYRDKFTSQEIVQRMDMCNNCHPFELNSLAFTDHKANFRIEVLTEFFAAIGIDSIATRLKGQPPFSEHALIKLGLSSFDKIPDSVIYNDLKDLVWRRNVVAHGWQTEILSPEMLKEKINYIKNLCLSLYQILRKELLPYLTLNRCQNLPEPIAIYKHNVICFTLKSTTLSVGDHIICRNTTGKYHEGKIIEIQVDNRNATTVQAPPTVSVGCKLDFKPKMNWEYFLLQPPQN